MVNKKETIGKLILGILVVCICIPMDSIDIFIESIKNSSFEIDIHYFWLNSLVFAGVYGTNFICILATIAYGDRFCEEYNNGLWRYVIARKGLKRYVIQNFVRCFEIGGITTCGGGVLFILATCPFFPLFNQDRYDEIVGFSFATILKENDVFYYLIMLFLLFLAGGLWACIGYCFSAYVPIKHMVYLFPFMVNFVMTRFFVICNIDNKWRFDLMLRGRSGPDNSLRHIEIVFITVICIVLLCVFLFYKKIKWRIENE